MKSLHIPEKTKLLSLPFMHSDSLQVHGLQDWSKARWEQELHTRSCMARVLISKLNIADAGDDDIALTLKQRLNDPLSLDQWEEVLIFQNFCENREHCSDFKAATRYPHVSLLSYSVFRRDFPRGVDAHYMESVEFAIMHSGQATTHHDERHVTTLLAYTIVLTGGLGVVAYLVVLYNRTDLWSLEATMQNWSASNVTHIINTRTRERGTFASLTNSLCFSLCVNSSLDKFARIDPSTSTVLIGILLGNTWGFVLDCMFGSDEGLREYLFSPMSGMEYALGSLVSWRFARYMITVIFDTFVSVILFHRLFPLFVDMVFFRTREWMANAVVSSIISVSTFQVYANMTRFQWAYPSGREDPDNPWISGSTMTLITVVANMVFLTTETRVRYGEAGINNPRNKIVITILAFLGLSVMQLSGAADAAGSMPIGVAGMIVHCPLKEVVATQKNALPGVVILMCISCVCFAYTIFGTSRLPTWVRVIPVQACVLVFYMCLMLALVLFFAFVPLFSTYIVRNTTSCHCG